MVNDSGLSRDFIFIRSGTWQQWCELGPSSTRRRALHYSSRSRRRRLVSSRLVSRFSQQLPRSSLPVCVGVVFEVQSFPFIKN